MAEFKKSTQIVGKFKNIIATEDGTFMDDETGSIIEVGKVLHSVYGDTPMVLSVSFKSDEPVE